MTPDPKPKKSVKDVDALRRFRLQHLGEPCDDCELRPGAHVHHVIFRSQSGDDKPENLAWLCQPCHDARHGL